MTATYQSMAGLDLTSYYGKKVNTIDGVPWKDAVEDPTTHAPYLTCDTLTWTQMERPLPTPYISRGTQGRGLISQPEEG